MCIRDSGLHQRQDQPHLDHRHRQREDQCPEGFADAVRDDFGMMDRGCLLYTSRCV